MPALTPQITLNVSLDDLQGIAAGSTANPARVLIALCNFGLQLPRIAGTAMLAKIGPYEILNDGSGQPFPILLFGNDVIVPGGTYYAITILDGNGNVVQTAAYIFTGTQNVNLADLPPINPGQPGVLGVYVVPSGGCVSSVIFDRTKGTGQSLTLTSNITSSTAQNFTPNVVVPFFIKQDAVGGRTFAWPANFIAPPAINLHPNGVTTSMWYLGGDGNFHQYGAVMYVDPIAPSTTPIQLSLATAPAGIDFGGIVALDASGGGAVLDGLKGRTQSLFLTTATGLAGANNFITGELITLQIEQDAIGGWTLTFDAAFQAPPPINEVAFGRTKMLLSADEFGNYYQFGVATWS